MPKIYSDELKQQALQCRRNGYTYTEIRELIKYPVAKSTFSEWFKNITLSEEAKKRITLKIDEAGRRGLGLSWLIRRHKRKLLLEETERKVSKEIVTLDIMNAKIALAMLYLAEGAKSDETVKFGNSDPEVIELFLNLLRKAFDTDEKKLRGKVQCRADQNTHDLERFWSNLSGIPLIQFNKSWKDKRTIGKPTKRTNYKGVFVIYYFSNRVFLELKFISDIIYKRSFQTFFLGR